MSGRIVTPTKTIGDRDTGGCGLFFGQCCSLVRKNALLKRRAKIQLVAELLVPAIIIGLLGTISNSVEITPIPGGEPTLDTPIPIYDLLQNHTLHPNVLCFDNNMFLRCGCHYEMSDQGGNYIYWQTIEATGLAMFATVHSRLVLDGMCAALGESTAPPIDDSLCVLMQFWQDVCGSGDFFSDISLYSSANETCNVEASESGLSAADYLELIADTVAVMDATNMSSFTIPEENISSVCQPLSYGVMGSNDGSGRSEASEFFDYVVGAFPETAGHWILYDSESEFEDVIQASDYSQEVPSENVIGLSAGIVFSSGNPDWEYTIRANLSKAGSEIYDYEFLNVPVTSATTQNNCKSPLDCPEELYPTLPWTTTYHQSPALVLQQLVDSWIMMQEGVDASALPTLRVTEFPWPSYGESGFWDSFGSTFATLVIMSVLYPISNAIRALVLEKELRIKEGLKMMGLSAMAHTLSWIFHFMCLFFCVSASIMVFSGSLFEFSDPVLIFLYFFLFFMAATAFCFCIAAFFSRAKTASSIGTFVFFVALFPFYTLDGDGQTANARRVGCLLPPTCLALGTLAFAEYEDSGEGVTQDTVDVSEDGFTFSDVLNMLILDMILFSILGWYLGNVIPNEWGTAFKPWFIFTRSYWCPSAASRGRMEHSREMLTFFESENRDSVEPVEDELKAQVTSGQCVAMRDLTKKFKNATGGSKLAVDGLDLTMFSGQITALLGHNGAGKTTTIGMLTGMIPVTSGVAFVGGRNVSVDMINIRKSLGVCPQHNILYPMLTVREHLRMYAVIKGVPHSKVSEVIKSILMDVGLTEKENELTKTLSGGQKRKLSVGIAFIGGSRVVFLDEPTSGMDPHSRRFTWDVIRRNREGRVIVLTTHFMDEADLLGDRIAIMADGALRCCGSSLFLKNHYGVGYNLTFVRNIDDKENEEKFDWDEEFNEDDEKFDGERPKLVDDEAQRECVKAIRRLVTRHVPPAILLSNVGSEISFQLPNDASPSFKAMLAEIDDRRDELSISSYGISVTTLEEVFLRVANGTADMDNRRLIAGITSRRKSSLSQSSAKVAAAIQVNDGPYAAKKLRPVIDRKSLFSAHVKTQIVKQALILKREKKMQCYTLLLPAAFVLLGILVLRSVSIPDEPTLLLDPQDYNSGGGAPLPYADGCTLTNGTCDASILMSYMDSSLSAEPIQLDFTDPESTTVGKLSVELLDLSYGGDNAYGALSFRQVNISTSEFDYTVHSNYSALHGVPVYMNQVNTAILRLLTGDDSLSISINMHPMPLTDFQRSGEDFSAIPITFFIMIAFSFMPSAWISYIVREKETKCKHQQMVSGMGINAFWLSTFTWEVLTYILPAAFTLIVLAANNVEDLIGGQAGTATILLFVLFGLSMPSYTHLLSFSFKSYSTAQNFFLFHNVLLGLILPIAVTVMSLFTGRIKLASEVMDYIFNLCPQFSLGVGLMRIGFIDALEATDDEIYEPLDTEITGKSLIYMACCAPLYFLLSPTMDRATRGDSWLFKLFCRLPTVKNSKKLSPRQLDEDSVDEDVAREAKRVKSGRAVTDVVMMRGLRKVYPTSSGETVAVRSLSLGIPKGECFGLLGINGAGKSSTLSMLSGELAPTAGSAMLAGLDVGKNLENIHQLVGYCPQFDALFETLTGREHLWHYARIKGIPVDKIEAAVEEKIEDMGLRQYCDKPAGSYSGGNKRKLSVAMAMIGNPQIVFLDEPSTGMDPVARRFMWNVIMRIVTENKECAMILTTHSMEECEALCQRIGIMVGGRMRCLGSAQHLKTRFGSGLQLEARVAATTQQETEEMLATMTQATNGQGNLAEATVLEAALTAAAAPELAAEITAEGRGASIHHAMEMRGYVDARDFASWIVLEKKCSKVISFFHRNFNGAVLREKQNAKMRLQIPQQAHQTLGDMFGFIEDNRQELCIGEYSLSQTSLEQIFNGFAAQKEAEVEPSPEK